MTSDNTMASDANVGCCKWTYPTINSGDLVVNCRAVGRYRAPVKGDVSSIKVDIDDMDITRCIKRIYVFVIKLINIQQLSKSICYSGIPAMISIVLVPTVISLDLLLCTHRIVSPSMVTSVVILSWEV